MPRDRSEAPATAYHGPWSGGIRLDGATPDLEALMAKLDQVSGPLTREETGTSDVLSAFVVQVGELRSAGTSTVVETAEQVMFNVSFWQNE